MLNIPCVKANEKWKISIYGKCPTLYSNLATEIIKVILYHQKISNPTIIELNFCTETEITKLNEELLGKSGPTDTISIPQFIKADEEMIFGTIFLCLPVIKKEALQEIPHFAHIVVHSVLHVLGYDHEEEEMRKSMEMKEVNILAKLGVKSPYL